MLQILMKLNIFYQDILYKVINIKQTGQHIGLKVDL